MRQKQRVFSLFLLSPSSRRAWIEINSTSSARNLQIWSPSSRRAWIEIIPLAHKVTYCRVALLTEGVDRNGFLFEMGCGKTLSPSSRRAWIEIGYHSGADRKGQGRPPHGGRG